MVSAMVTNPEQRGPSAGPALGVTPVMVIGLDSMDKDLVFQWSQEGLLPTFEKLIGKSINGQIGNPHTEAARFAS